MKALAAIYIYPESEHWGAQVFVDDGATFEVTAATAKLLSGAIVAGCDTRYHSLIDVRYLNLGLLADTSLQHVAQLVAEDQARKAEESPT